MNEGLTIEADLGARGPAPDDDTVDELLERVVVLARDVMDSADVVSITMADNGSYRTSNATGDDARVVDQAQYDGDDGPCVQAVRSRHQVHTVVGAETSRWSEFDERARQLGVTAVLSTPLDLGSKPIIGALNVYARKDHAFDETDRARANAIAEHAAFLFGSASALADATRLNHQLRQAVASREIIGEAKGIIMERQGCTRDEAFEVLRRASQRENRKLRDLSEELVRRVETRVGGEYLRR